MRKRETVAATTATSFAPIFKKAEEKENGQSSKPQTWFARYTRRQENVSDNTSSSACPKLQEQLGQPRVWMKLPGVENPN